MDQYIGRLLDNRYEILEIIGTGGMAVVYKARCHRLNRLVAIKILKDEFSRDEEFRRRFHAEGEAVAMLSHPNIVQVFDVSSSNNANFIVMELIDGISLKQYMQAKGILNWKETLHFAMQIAAGLEHAHSRGIVHRDIKPHNVMVLKNGSVKVMDFGIARVMSKSNTLTKEALGSVHYISPEQAKGSHTDNRSALYSLGVVMYEMMAGRPPYDGESPVAVAIQHINGGAVVPSNFNPNLPRGLEQIIMKAMALELPDRFGSAGEMLKDMEEFRKNPAIDFHYISFIDDATRKMPVLTATPAQPRTTAEKMERSKTGTVSQRISEPVRAPKPAPAAPVKKLPPKEVKPQRPVAPVQKKEPDPKPSKVGAVAIVACSLVAAFAIIVFLVALFNGMLLNRDRDLIEVPNFVGEMYTEDMQEIYSDFQIRFNDQRYDDRYAKGVIIDQEPAAGNGIRVQKGAEIWITISMGEEPAVKMMESLVGLNAEEAASYLKGQGFTPLVWREYNEFYEEGHVIRTDPAEGTELVEGQTIKLVVSRGPQVNLQEMPDVTGMDEATARKVLNQLGFSNVETRSAESDRPKGTVIKQSELEGDMIDITTQIILTLSEGPAETQPPKETEAETTAPEETEPKEVIMDVTFYLPVKEEVYTLTIFCNGWQVTAAREIQPGISEIIIEMSGSGTRRYDLYIDDVYFGSQDVVFGQYG